MQLNCIPRISSLLFILLLSGCGPAFGLPSICEPGTASQKLAEAKKFDPFPDPNMGPEIVGGRPLGFMTPREDPDFTKRPLPTFPYNAPVAGPYAAPASYYPSSNVIAPPATAAAPAATVAYPPPTVLPSAATRAAPQSANLAPQSANSPTSSNTGNQPLVPLDYSTLPAVPPNPSDYKTTSWPTNLPPPPAYGKKITGP